MLLTILKGLFFGGLASLIGYLKQEQIEKWDFTKMLKTMIVGAVTTSIIQATGLSLAELSFVISTWLAQNGISLAPGVIETIITTAIIVFADQLVKIIVRRTDLVRLWNKLKELISNYWQTHK